MRSTRFHHPATRRPTSRRVRPVRDPVPPATSSRALALTLAAGVLVALVAMFFAAAG